MSLALGLYATYAEVRARLKGTAGLVFSSPGSEGGRWGTSAFIAPKALYKALRHFIPSAAQLEVFKRQPPKASSLFLAPMQPHGWPQVSDHPDLIVPFNLTSFALSLLMLYKTNSSYARWWEARTHLGQLYINVRSVMRMVSQRMCHASQP